MVLTHRPVTPDGRGGGGGADDAHRRRPPDRLRAVGVRGPRAARRTTRGSWSRAAGTATSWSPTRRSCRGRRTTAASTSCSSATSTRRASARATAPRCSAAPSTRPGGCTRRTRPGRRAALPDPRAGRTRRPGRPAGRARPRRRPPQLPDVLRPDRAAGPGAAGRPRAVAPSTRRPPRSCGPPTTRRSATTPTAPPSTRQTWNGFMVNARAHPPRPVLRAARPGARTARVAAYVFVHEYALAPSGEPGPGGVRRLRRHAAGPPRTRPGHPPARPHAARLPGRPASTRPASTSTPRTRPAPWGSTSAPATPCATARTTTRSRRSRSRRPGRPAHGCAPGRAGPPRRRATAPTAARICSPSRASPRRSRSSRGASTHTSVVTRSSMRAGADPTPSTTSRPPGESGCDSAQAGRVPVPAGPRRRPARRQRAQHGVDGGAQPGQAAPALQQLVGVHDLGPGEGGQARGRASSCRPRPGRRCTPAVPVPAWAGGTGRAPAPRAGRSPARHQAWPSPR